MAASRTESTAPPAPAGRSLLGQAALYERVAERLRERILAHTLAPGSWIDEQDRKSVV